MAMLESILDDLPLYSALRIAPLQDPFPDLSAHSDRPSPLEPNARVDDTIDDGTAKLSGRRKALAEAKPIGEPTGSNNLRPIQRNPRKRQKLHEHERIADFVQLPQPLTKAKNDKPPPFDPISVLNELHEPPPSAALFPPITPQDVLSDQRQHPINPAHRSPQKEGTPAASNTSIAGKTLQSPSPKPIIQRSRRKWSKEETEQLMKGIELFGFGKWKKILHHPAFSFQPGRTAVDLKDHFRTKTKSGFVHNNNRKGAWTETEDAALDKGYEKHGFCWTEIAQDPDLHLSHKTGPQVRDRFRTKFPELYGGDFRKESSRQRSTTNRKGAWTEVEDAELEKGHQKHGFSWTKILHDPSLNLAHKTGAQIRDRFRTRFPSLYGLDSCHDITDRTAPKKKRRKDKSKQQAQGIQSSRVKNNNHLIRAGDTTAGAEEPNLEEMNESIDQSSNESEDDTVTKANDGVHRDKPSGLTLSAHNIMDLLNSGVEDEQPSSPLRLDEWDANVTLPPLLWEEMATRPMFDLE